MKITYRTAATPLPRNLAPWLKRIAWTRRKGAPATYCVAHEHRRWTRLPPRLEEILTFLNRTAVKSEASFDEVIQSWIDLAASADRSRLFTK